MSEIVKSVSIENLVNQRAAVASLLEQGLKTLREAFTLSRAAHSGFAEIQMVVNGQRNHSHRICGDSSEPLVTLFAVSLKSVDAGAWSYLMHESGLRTFMDATARKEWDERIGSCRSAGKSEIGRSGSSRLLTQPESRHSSPSCQADTIDD